MKQSLPITEADVNAIDRELCSRSLVEFVRYMWPVLEPSKPYVHSWHIDAIAEHLEAVTNGELTRLLINIPPGTMKSLLVSVFWGAWEWGPRGMPYLRFLGTSHKEGLATRDNMRARRLIESPKFQKLWPVRLTSDQNAKTKFENVDTGFREAMAIASMTGSRGDRVIVDDPHTVDGTDSEAKREDVCDTFFEGVSNRLNDPETSAIVVVMQRLHERDLSGQILARGLDYEHLMLPMEFEPERKCVTSIGFEDPRKDAGELLFPARFPADVVARDKRVMGQYASAGQLQQRPAPREGGMFKVDKFEIVPWVDSEPVETMRYWDKAGTQGGGAYTAGVRMSILEDGTYLIEDVVRGQWSAAQRERNIKLTAKNDGHDIPIWMEQEPGSSGKDVAALSVKNLAGYTARADRPNGKGSKEVRAEPYSAQVEIGNVKLIEGEWNEAFIEEHRLFPRGTYKDQVDAASGAFNKLARRTSVPGLAMSDAGKQDNPFSMGLAI